MSLPVPSGERYLGPGHQALDLIAHLVAAIEVTPLVAVRSVDRDGIVRFWNHSSARLYGVATEHALGRPLEALMRPASRAADYAAALDRVWRTGRPGAARDWCMRLPDGRAVWIYSTMFPVGRDGVPQQIFCMDVDITARKAEDSARLAAGANFRHLVERSCDAIVLLRRGRIAAANPAALSLFGCAGKDALLRRTLAQLSPPCQADGEASAAAARLRARQARAQGNLRYDWRYLNGAGQPFWAEVLMTSVTLDRQPTFYTVIRDISVRKAAEQSLCLAAQVFENSRDAIVLTDGGHVIAAVNRAYSDVTGFHGAQMLGQPLGAHRCGIEDEAQYQRILAAVEAGGHWQGEVWAVRANGQRYPAWLTLTAIRDARSQVCNYMGMLSDITERKQAEAQTRHQAEHDFLTGLPNRALLLDRLNLALTAARRHHSLMAILFLDLDRFKHINDALGHHVGDLLLREVAARLVRCVRAVDTVSRQGGDEFLIVLTDIGAVDQAAHVAATVLQSITQQYVLEQHRLDVTTSIGIAVYPGDGTDADTLVRHADLAMYHAKQHGRNRYQFFNAEMNLQITERLRFESDLRRAVAERQFELAFQPELDMATGQVLGMEALVRWRHPELGLLAPSRFIGVAEDCGLMVAIGTWVLQEACRHARGWQDEGRPLVVAVNLSPSQFMQRGLAATVREALAASALPSSLLALEITETVLMHDGGGALATLQNLRAMGVSLVIDDFGTGYSRLGHLKDCPVDKLKIDRSFVNDFEHEPAEAAVVSAIIALAHSLKMKVLAEGVETAAQLQYLREQGCDQYQGSYLRGDGMDRA
ncbi:EAL domain-containing protein [Duganella sp. LX20W]|uniref:EAL domain-containing protein n=1 Tax=Rugamonas brunnea TaxID=2758569 RepID=A0A7W2IDH4_9BURK|nr:bifunctional diguanylate cyclase/phosphodiesterase [Rugamonas brunnea]MBA5638997.1 EAL domain-containing protein [Rugamonas brunnea]